MRDVEGVRREIQHKLEYSGTQWECKLNLFVKDSDQRAKQSQEQIKRVKDLIQNLHNKGIQECDLHNLREKLQKQHHEHLERGDLIEQYKKESDELDGLIRDIQK